MNASQVYEDPKCDWYKYIHMSYVFIIQFLG